MDKFSQLSPVRIIVHGEHIVTVRDEVLDDVGGWAITVDGAPLVDKFFDQAAVRQDDGSPGTELKRKDATILMRPLGEPSEIRQTEAVNSMIPKTHT